MLKLCMLGFNIVALQRMYTRLNNEINGYFWGIATKPSSRMTPSLRVLLLQPLCRWSTRPVHSASLSGQINIPMRGPAFACATWCVSIFHCLSIKRPHECSLECNRAIMTVSLTQKTKSESGWQWSNVNRTKSSVLNNQCRGYRTGQKCSFSEQFSHIWSSHLANMMRLKNTVNEILVLCWLFGGQSSNFDT